MPRCLARAGRARRAPWLLLACLALLATPLRAQLDLGLGLELGGVLGRSTLRAAAARSEPLRVSAVRIEAARAPAGWERHDLAPRTRPSRAAAARADAPRDRGPDRPTDRFSERPTGSPADTVLPGVPTRAALRGPASLSSPPSLVPVEPAGAAFADLVGCAEPGLRNLGARRHAPLLTAEPDLARPGSVPARRDARRDPWEPVRELPLLDFNIAGQDIQLAWSAGRSTEGVRPASGGPVSLDTAGDTEIIELQWRDPSGEGFSTFVRGRREPDDAYASAFGRGIEGTAGIQYVPGGRWEWRLQAQQLFVNHVTEPIQAMEFSLWARMRF